MCALYVTGDIHGDAVDRFSFRRQPITREFTEEDVVVILGDFGIPFGVQCPHENQEAELYDANWLNKKRWITLAIAGNHDDRDAIAAMPLVEKFGGKVRQLSFCGETFENIFYVDTPQILTIQNKKCLCIPGAESHDIDVLLDPEDDHFDRMLKKARQNYHSIPFRIKHWSWWENEAVDVQLITQLINEHSFEKFDFIFTHDAPALMNKYCGFPDTEGELLLESIRRNINFNEWYHGHYHKDAFRYKDDPRVTCLYKSIWKVS